ncbi:MAG: YCII-related protein [Nocardia sp.]|uniref:YciI family protein n=1 Tax=Nocardia sp. TaxID=1821 RepID=UPI00261AF950|nr:YciI family protein [Nocardia sp.]MCU1640150.1 YCII-related protein [Nocardia sp.]
MKYLLMIATDESKVLEVEGCSAWAREMTERGVLHEVTGLRPTSDATTVRVRAAEVLLSDGPFAETKDQIGGAALIECADLDEAIDIASRHPAAALGAIEVRPLMVQ